MSPVVLSSRASRFCTRSFRQRPSSGHEFQDPGIRLTDTVTIPTSVLLNRLLARGKFRHLQVLLRLAELGSVQRTADAIGVTQSSVTQTLAYVEGLLEAKLFQRHARGVMPTPACQDLLPIARQMMMSLADGADVIAARGRRGGGVVRLLASIAAIHGVLVEELPRFHTRYPAIEVHVREAEGEDQLLALARGEVDLLACRRPVAVPEGWAFDAMGDDEIVVVARPGHQLHRRRRADWGVLSQALWLLPPAETLARLRFDAMVQQHFGAPPRSHPLVTRNFALTLKVIQAQPVLALLPMSFARNLLIDGQIAQVPTPDALPLAPLGLLRPDPIVAPAVRSLIDFLLAGKAGPLEHRDHPAKGVLG